MSSGFLTSEPYFVRCMWRSWNVIYFSTSRVLLLVIVCFALIAGYATLPIKAEGDTLQIALEVAHGEISHNSEWLEQYPIGFEIQFEDGVPMVLVPAGCYEMGGDPQAFYWTGFGWQQGVPDAGRICFPNAFWIDKYEVTQEQFERLGGEAEHRVYFERANRPREGINWFEARDFCTLRGARTNAEVRLPTEAEWEYAARGVDGWHYPWGSDWLDDRTVWHRGYDLATADVGSLPAGASWVGAMDMSGNVWEWMLTTYQPYPYPVDDDRLANDAQWIDGENSTAPRGLRGGSWNNSYGDELRAAYRLWNYPDYTNLAIGFRCVRRQP